jgi:hypothetical protein
MNSVSDIEMNVPARVKGWAPEGGAHVELLSRVGVHDIGTVVTVSLRPNPKGHVYDFDYHRKKSALRTGGLVLLRKFKLADDGTGTIKSIDVLLENDRGGTPYVVQGAAISLLPPPPSAKTAMVEEAVVAMIGDGITISSVKDGAKRIRQGLEQAAVFGKPGVILTGELKSGDVAEMVLGGEPDLTVDDIIYSLEHGTDSELMANVRSSKAKWYLIPFFKADVDPDKTKISAQRLNFSPDDGETVGYGDGEVYGWTRSNCVLRAYGTEWIVIDTAVVSDTEDTEAGLLIDIIEM